MTIFIQGSLKFSTIIFKLLEFLVFIIFNLNLFEVVTFAPTTQICSLLSLYINRLSSRANIKFDSGGPPICDELISYNFPYA